MGTVTVTGSSPPLVAHHITTLIVVAFNGEEAHIPFLLFHTFPFFLGRLVQTSSRMSPRPPNLLVSAATSSSRRDYQILTPRTPHSRAGRAEEGYTEIELEQGGQDDNDTHYSGTQHQSEPLLASSSSDTFPPSGIRARGDDQEFRRGRASALERVVKSAMKHAGLALGSLLALILFFMIIVAYREPEVMMEAIGANKTALGSVDELQTGTSEPAAVPSPTQSSAAATETPLNEHIISYAQYDHFPLYPHQYRDECDKLMSGLIPPAPYWSGDKDVVHHDTVDPGNDPTPEGARTSICTSTITYQLDGYVGLLADLALMAQAAALAREVCASSSSTYGRVNVPYYFLMSAK